MKLYTRIVNRFHATRVEFAPDTGLPATCHVCGADVPLFALWNVPCLGAYLVGEKVGL